MKKIYAFLMIGFMFSLFSCENDEGLAIEKEDVIVKDIVIANQQTEKVTVSENGYLVFKDQESYSEILNNIDKMTDDEFTLWEKSIGFESAQTFLADFYEKLENVDTYEEYEILQQQFSDKLVFESDGSIRLNFYATAWDRVLNVDGIMKIGNTLHKFEKDRQLLINDGDYSDIKNFQAIKDDTCKVRIFIPRQHIDKCNLKSMQWGWVDYYEYETGKKRGDKKLECYIQIISYNYTGYGFTNVYYTEAGFEVRIKLSELHRNVFKKWVNRTTQKKTYYIRNARYHIEYNKMSSSPLMINPSKVIAKADFADKDRKSSYHILETMYKYYDYRQGNYPHVEPDIHEIKLTVWSGGIGYDNRINMWYSNQ
jgi:hypothetical protein